LVDWILNDTVDGRNPAPVDMVNIPLFIYKVLYMPGGAGFLPSTVLVVFSTDLHLLPFMHADRRIFQ